MVSVSRLDFPSTSRPRFFLKSLFPPHQCPRLRSLDGGENAPPNSCLVHPPSRVSLLCLLVITEFAGRGIIFDRHERKIDILQEGRQVFGM